MDTSAFLSVCISIGATSESHLGIVYHITVRLPMHEDREHVYYRPVNYRAEGEIGFYSAQSLLRSSNIYLY